MKNETPRWWKRIALTATLIAACIGVVATVNGCSEAVAQENAWQGDSHRFYRVRIGQCAYAVYDNGRHGGIVHAGDCRNPIHKENQR